MLAVAKLEDRGAHKIFVLRFPERVLIGIIHRGVWPKKPDFPQSELLVMQRGCTSRLVCDGQTGPRVG